MAVVRLRSLGDCVLTTPALSILKRSRPDLEVGVVVEANFAPVFEGSPDVDAIISPSVRYLRKWGPRLSINLHGGTRSLRLTAFSGARLRAGFAHHRFSALYNVPIPRAQQVLGVDRKVHTAEHLASAVFYLGAGRTEIPRARLFVAGPTEERVPEYAVIHPRASTPAKTWPAGKFLAVARRLKMEAVFVAGPGEDLSAFHEFRTLEGAPLAAVKELLSRASLFVGNDSGPAHMAAAFGIPSVVIFGDSDHRVWAPWKAPAEVIVAQGPIADVEVRRVLEAIERLRIPA